jgi:hypothetical protein
MRRRPWCWDHAWPSTIPFDQRPPAPKGLIRLTATGQRRSLERSSGGSPPMKRSPDIPSRSRQIRQQAFYPCGQRSSLTCPTWHRVGARRSTPQSVKLSSKEPGGPSAEERIRALRPGTGPLFHSDPAMPPNQSQFGTSFRVRSSEMLSSHQRYAQGWKKTSVTGRPETRTQLASEAPAHHSDNTHTSLLFLACLPLDTPV